MVVLTLLRSSFNCIKTKWSVWSSGFVPQQWILLPGHFWECIKQKSQVLDPTQYSKPNLLCRRIVALIIQQGVLMCLRTGSFFFQYSQCIFSQNEDEGVAQWQSTCPHAQDSGFNPKKTIFAREREKKKKKEAETEYGFYIFSIQ